MTEVAAARQAGVPAEVTANLAMCERLTDDAAEAGARIIVPPEFCTTGMGLLPELVDCALPPEVMAEAQPQADRRKRQHPMLDPFKVIEPLLGKHRVRPPFLDGARHAHRLRLARVRVSGPRVGVSAGNTHPRAESRYGCRSARCRSACGGTPLAPSMDCA